MKTAVHRQLGKLPARRDAVKLKFCDYLTGTLPPVPATFGHETLIPSTAWGMLANDLLGDCVIAGACHETMLWTREGGSMATFTDKQAVAAYSAITGYSPRKPNSDQGTDMELAAKYRRKTGIKDATGKVHKVGAYLDLTPGDLQEHLRAAYLFQAVGIGIQFPASAMDQFNAGKPWDVMRGAKLEGGHYIPLVANRGVLEVVTWGRLQGMTSKFFAKYNDESVVYLSEEMLVDGKSIDGFDLAGLQADLKALTA